MEGLRVVKAEAKADSECDDVDAEYRGDRTAKVQPTVFISRVALSVTTIRPH